MKNSIMKSFMLLIAAFAISVTGCVNDGFNEENPTGGSRHIASLDAQTASIEVSVAEIKALQKVLDSEDPTLASALSSLENHVAFLKGGADFVEGTLATLAQQKNLAAAIGVLQTRLGEDNAYESEFDNLEKSVNAWIGKRFDSYYPAAVAEAKAEAVLTSLSQNLGMQKLYVEGVASDLEAGLMEGADLEGFAALLSSIDSGADAVEELRARYAAVVSDVEDAYKSAISAAENDESSDMDELVSVNKTARVEMKAAEITLEELAGRVAACEAEVASLKEKVSALEGKVESLEELLDLIQSVTFMSEFSEDRIIAYYNLDTESDERTPEGYMLRTRAESITLKYIVRPAAAASALAEATTLWNNGLNVMGYYAEAITKAAPAMEDFAITNVTADVSGVMTVTVANTLLDDFYFKKTGAKMALSIKSGKTDLASKFIEIVPKDASNTVYAEGLTITEAVEVEMNQSMTLKAAVTPAGANQTVTWNTNTESVAKITDAGLLTGWSAGTAEITATAVAVDEWGRQLTATCDVKVNPDIKIVGPKYVENGSYVNLRIESPRAIDQSKVTWTTSHPSNVSVEKSFTDGFNRAKVNGNAVLYEGDKYKDITLTCTIEGEPTLTHTIQCVEVQPRKIVVGGLDDDENEITLKFGESRTFSGVSVDPAGVDAGKFTLAYATSGAIYKSSDNLTVTAQDENQLKNGKTTGTYTVSLNSAYYWYDQALQQSADKLTRNITVNVEPYYITSFSIPVSQNMTINHVLSQLPDITFTSDVGGHEPSYTDLIWSSSAPEYVSVDESGKLVAHQVTTEAVEITAKVKNPEISVKPGATVADAVCYVNVTESAANEPKIGDFYFADGTFATDLPADYDHSESDNKVIGIIFSLVNATEDDPKFAENGYGSYVNGLVVSLDEYENTVGYMGQNFYIVEDLVGKDNAYGKTKTVGYGNTCALSAWSHQNSTAYGLYYAQLYRMNDANGTPYTHNSNVESPASPWYIPSFKEMSLIRETLGMVNENIKKLAPDMVIEEKNYWTSSFDEYSLGGYDIALYSMSTNSWVSLNKTTSCFDNYPVRVILAF